MRRKGKKILMLAQFPEHISPGQRFRFEMYKDILHENGFEVVTHSFFDYRAYQIIYRYGFLKAKISATLKGFFGRFLLTFTIYKYDYIFLQREVAPLGPPVFEWLYSKVLKKKLIYDFDDAIWIPIISKQNDFARFFKNANKVKKICKWAYKVSCGNNYLCNFASAFNKNVVYNPTCVDVVNRYNILANHNAPRVTVGWTGSFSTMIYLPIVVPALQKLQEKYDFDIKIICNQRPQVKLKNLKYVEWSEENEVAELASCEIGIMPLSHDEWSEGKCGFKLIQYLALEIPAVSSPIGVNKVIIEDGVNGFFANSDEEWYRAIEKLILYADLRKQFGKEGREKIKANYSLQSNVVNFLSLFS